MNQFGFAFLFVALICLHSFDQCHAQHVAVEGRAMGMPYRVLTAQPQPADLVSRIRESVQQTLTTAEDTFSLYRVDSEIARWNANGSTDWISASRPLVTVLEYSRRLAQATNGAFDPTLRPLTELWQFDKRDHPWAPPTASQLAERLRRVGIDRIHTRIDPPSIRKEIADMELDLNALVEGWCLDCVASSLETLVGSDFLVQLGGEYIGRGTNEHGLPWRILIETPTLPQDDVLTRALPPLFVNLSNRAVSTSGNYRSGRFHDGKWYGHVLDARTGLPIAGDSCLASVVSSSALEADGWATALLTMDEESARKLCDDQKVASCILRNTSGRFQITRSRLGSEYFQRVENQHAATGLTSGMIGWGIAGAILLAAIVSILWFRR